MIYPNPDGTIVTKEEHQQTGARGTAGLHPQLIGLEGWRVEVEDDDGNVRRFIVGKSTGWMPCHLEISRRDSDGGPAVSSFPYKRVTKLYQPERTFRNRR